jgi:hypothetical protein
MARYRYVIVSRAKPGQEEEFARWYAEQHLADVGRHPHVVSGSVHLVDYQKDYDLDAPKYTLLTIYDLETDDPQATIEDIRSQAGSPGMPMTESLEKSGMLQVIARQIASVG